MLRPTLRKPGSQIWFTYNPRLRSDPVDVMMRQDARFADSRTVVEANWRDNPFRGPELEEERLLDLAGDEARYRHIWEGDYEAESDMQFIGGGLVREPWPASRSRRSATSWCWAWTWRDSAMTAA